MREPRAMNRWMTAMLATALLSLTACGDGGAELEDDALGDGVLVEPGPRMAEPAAPADPAEAHTDDEELPSAVDPADEDPADEPADDEPADDEPADEEPEADDPAPAEERPCMRDATRCGPDGTMQVCDRHETWIDVPCPAGRVCTGDPARCAPQVCEPGASRCSGASTRERCVGGASWAIDRCPDDHICGEDEVSGDAICQPTVCQPRVMFLVDRSRSMDDHWPTVRETLGVTMADNVGVPFGLGAFPSLDGGCGPMDIAVRISDEGPGQIDQWMDRNRPGGSTPLISSILLIADDPDRYLGVAQGTNLVVLTDGNDGCGCAGGDCLDQLASATAALAEAGVNVYVIGYAFYGAPAELDIIAANGGTAFDHYLPAEDDEALRGVLANVLNDIKLCPGG